MSENYLEAKAVLNEVKSSTWRFFKFRVVGRDVDKSFVHCKLCLDQGNKKRGQIKYCGGTTNLLLLMRIGWKQFFLVMHLYFSFLLPWKNYFANLRLVEINWRLIGAPFSLIVIARQLILKRFSPLITIGPPYPICVSLDVIPFLC